MDQWEPSPFLRLMGVKVLMRSAERTESELFIREDLCNRRGVMHGGAVMAWGDTLGGMTASAALTEGQRTATIESKTNFIGAAQPGSRVIGESTPLHRGRRTMVWQTRVTTADGKLVAMVTQTQLVFPTPA